VAYLFGQVAVVHNVLHGSMFSFCICSVIYFIDPIVIFKIVVCAAEY